MKPFIHFRYSLLIAGTALGLLSGCGGSGKEGGSAQSPSNPFNGIWQASGYGKILRIDDTELEMFDYTDISCILSRAESDISQNEFSHYFRLDENHSALEEFGSFGTGLFHAPTISYQAVQSLPDLCLNPIPTSEDINYQPDLISDFEIFWQTFQDYYLSFNLKEVDWYDVKTESLSLLQTQPTEQAFVEALYQAIEPLSDGHVSFTLRSGQEISVNNKPSYTETLYLDALNLFDLTPPFTDQGVKVINAYVESEFDQALTIISNYADTEIKAAANDNIRWFMQGNIGYLNINAMQGFSLTSEVPQSEMEAIEHAMQAAMSELKNTSGLIIDIRLNQGGNDYASMKLFSYFLENTQLMFSKQSRLGSTKTDLKEAWVSPAQDVYTRPIVLLTSNTTASAAEVFTLGMRSLPNVTLMGEPTQGEFSDQLEKTLPNGISFTLSNEFYYSPNGEWFEHKGVPVDMEIPFLNLEQRDEGEDRGLETAYAFLTGQL